MIEFIGKNSKIVIGVLNLQIKETSITIQHGRQRHGIYTNIMSDEKYTG